MGTLLRCTNRIPESTAPLHQQPNKLARGQVHGGVQSHVACQSQACLFGGTVNDSVFYNGDSALPGFNPEFPTTHTPTRIKEASLLSLEVSGEAVTFHLTVKYLQWKVRLSIFSFLLHGVRTGVREPYNPPPAETKCFGIQKAHSQPVGCISRLAFSSHARRVLNDAADCVRAELFGGLICFPARLRHDQ